jgi:hypothetical protein
MSFPFAEAETEEYSAHTVSMFNINVSHLEEEIFEAPMS